MRLARSSGYLYLCLLLSSCTGLPPHTAADLDWHDRSTLLLALTGWNNTGKLSIRTLDQSESANLKWSQAGNRTRIRLSGPLGMGATSIESDTQQLQVSRNGETRHYDISSQAASTASIGWELPLQALPYWILGLPSPQTPVLGQLVKNGLLRRLEQLGWTVTYETYGQFEQYTLPTRLKLEHGSTRARLIIRNWTQFSS